METKEKASILEQAIQHLEKEQKKEIAIKKIGMFSYVVLLLAWSSYFGDLFCHSFLAEASKPFNIWVQTPFQIALFLSAIVLFASYLRNKIVTKKREKLISAIEVLKFCIKKGVPSVEKIISCEDVGTIKIYFEEGIKIFRIIEILPEKDNDLIIFREGFHKEISSLSEEQKKKYLRKLYELEDFFAYF